MSEFKKIEKSIEGLHCANCAMKIEHVLKDVENIKNVSIDFVNQTLHFEVDSNENTSELNDKINSIASKIEHGVVIKDNEFIAKQEKPAKNKLKAFKFQNITVRLVISLILLGSAVLFNDSFIISFPLFLVSYFIIGYDVLHKAIKNIANGQIFDENFLMCLATVGAFIIGEYPEAVGVMIFYQIGEYFQDKAVNRSRKSIIEMMDIKPEFANLDVDGIIKKVSPETVSVDDIIVVKPGERVPLDGEILKGSSSLNTVSLTGESIPREVDKGDEVLSGSINLTGLLTIKVTKEYKDSIVSKILELVQNANSKKAKTENFITKFARYYTPAVVITALIIALIPPLLIENATFSDWVYRALIFLVVSCPCALVISIPLSFFGGIGGASKNGILVKGGNYLEALNNVDTVVFDKTGTLTKGIFSVTQINSSNSNLNEEELLEYVAYAESFSNHPVAKSILQKYGKSINKEDIKDFSEISGQGIEATVKAKHILIGNSKLMDNNNISYEKINSLGTILYVAFNNEYVGYLIIADELKEDAKEAIKGLKDLKINKTIMLTGDINDVGKKISTDLGIDEFYAELLPNEKVEIYEEISDNKTSNGKTIFVGDGINDAPVLARSDVGIAMGGIGSDAAIEAADVVIMTDEPSKIVKALKIAKFTNKIVWQNIIFALGIKALVLVLGAIGVATMWEAVFADVGVALIAVLNSMRVLRN